MQYLCSKDFVITSGREVLFYDSAKYNPPDNLRPSPASTALAVLRKARSVLGSDGLLNPIAGVSSNLRHLTSLKWGTYENSFDLIDLCTRDRSSDPISPMASYAGKWYVQYNDEGINTISLLAVTASITSVSDYYFTNPTYTGDVTVTFTFDAQLATGTKQSNRTSTIVYRVYPLASGGRYIGQSTFSFSGDTCAYSFGKRLPTFSRTDNVCSQAGSSTTKVVQTTNDPNEWINIDCFLMYDPTSGVFKKYGSDMIADIATSLVPGTRPAIKLNSRSEHAAISL